MRLADFRQQTDESIVDYLERTGNLVTKFPTEELDIGMATVRGINNRVHQEWIERECHRAEDFTFTSVSKLVKVSYTKIGQPDPFDSSVRHTPKLKTAANSVQVQNELLQQLLRKNCRDASSNPARNENNCQRQYASQQESRSTIGGRRWSVKSLLKRFGQYTLLYLWKDGPLCKLSWSKKTPPPVVAHAGPVYALPINMVSVLKDCYC